MQQLLILPTYAIILIGYIGIAFFLTLFANLYKTKSPEIVSLILFIRNTVLPTGSLIGYLLLEQTLPAQHSLLLVTENIFGILLIWVLASFATVVAFTKKKEAGLKDTVPGLVVDITRFSILILGGLLVTAFVWDQSFSHLIATLGVGSVVLGFALQETLGNLFSGIALYFEQPFQLADWIKVGDTIGEVVETNWRSVRIRTRELTLVAVPNSVLTKERIFNFSRPTQTHGILLYVGFSYNDPPFKVKQALREVLSQTPHVLSYPPFRIRTKNFDESAVLYEMKFFIDDYGQLPEIEEDVMTRIWYAARRYHLTIPYPIRTVYHSQLPPTNQSDTSNESLSVIDRAPLFSDLSADLKEWLSNQVIEMTFGSGERVITQGDDGDALYVIAKGKAIIKYQDIHGEEKTVLELFSGDYFGERALYTDEPRSAHVYAVSDLQLLSIYKETFQELIRREPELAHKIAELIEERDKHLIEQSKARGESTGHIKASSKSDILSRIRNFLKVT